MSDSDDDTYDPEPSRVATDDFLSNLPEQQQFTGPNKIQELIEDNKFMQNALRQTSTDMSKKYIQLLEFYKKIKASAQVIRQQYERSEERINSQQKEITFLKVERVNLKEELRREKITRELGGLEINDTNAMNGRREEGEEDKAEYDDTVNALSEQLKKADEEKEKMKEDFRNKAAMWKEQWDLREQTYSQHFKQGVQELSYRYDSRIEEIKAEHNTLILGKENDNQTLKTQVTQLIAELHDNQKSISNYESVITNLRSNSQTKESRIYQLSKEFESLKEQSRGLTEEVVELKRQNEDLKRQKEEKEKSLDELFEEYNRERELKQQIEQQLLNEQSGLQSEKLDKAYAQYLGAEESLKRKNDEVTKLKKSLEEADSRISVYKQQADIFEKDFIMEREARQKSHSECENLKGMVGQYQIEMQRMKQELIRSQERNYTQPRQPYGH